MKYTVIGYYEDNGQIWTEWVDAKDESRAVVKAVKSLEKLNEYEDSPKNFRSNVVLVGVLKGHHKEISGQEKVCAAIDWPGLEIDK